MIGRWAWFLLVLSFLANSALAQSVAPREPLRLVPEKEVGAPRLGQPVRHFPRFPVTGTGTRGLPAFSRAAGMIFSGTVIRVEQRPARPGETVAMVMVTFHVENAIRGVTQGEDLTISQWLGLWSSGQQYRRGERVMLFLYPTSKLGLTSWVGGRMGRFAMDARGQVLLDAEQVSAFQTDSVLGGRSRVLFSDFALAVRRASEED